MSTARNAVFSFALALSPLIAFLPAACGGGNTNAESAAEPAEAEPDEQPTGEDGKGWGGWRWKGKRQECFFRYGNSCYDKLEAACRAARCAESQCQRGDGVPAVVSCRR